MLKKRKFTVFDFVRMAFITAPGWALIIFIQKILASLLPTVSVLVTARFIDTAIGIFNNQMPRESIYPLLFALCGLTGYEWVIGNLMQYVNSKMLLAARIKFRAEIINKRARLNYQHIECQNTYDLISRITEKSENQIQGQYASFLELFVIAFRVVGLMSILIINIWWAGIAILAFSIPLFYLGIKSGKQNYEAQREMSKIDRKAWYLRDILNSRENVEERTMFGYGNAISKMFWERFEVSRKYKQKIEKKNFFRIKIGGGVVSIISGLIIAVLLQPVASGIISVGMFMSLVNASMGLAQMLSWALSWQLNELAKNREYLKDLTKFCELDETDGALDVPVSPSPTFNTLEFRNVKFTYPGVAVPVLNGVSFRIEKSKHYSFVGANGAGKTTITKLLTGQYAQYEGEILLNGKNLKEYTQPELKAMFGVIYQDFAKYYITLGENISLGNVNTEDDNKINEAVKLMELNDVIDKLPKGLTTPLGKIKEDGVDISGGEWQRIAMARIIMNPAPVKILDEPTAALDPISESRVYSEFKEISKGSTAIFISHRLGSTKLADEILVFDGGVVAEKGTHNELMQMNGIYSKMYMSQLEWYRVKGDEVTA